MTSRVRLSCLPLIGAAVVCAALTIVLVPEAPAQAAATRSAQLAPTPPMGWNDWNAFGCSVSADLIEKTAQAMVDDGMAAAGYKYVNIDDCWMAGSEYSRTDARRATAGRVGGHLVTDATNFPDGIEPVADFVHKLGLKLGIYESAGSTTCQGLAGSYGHEQTDAEDFARWGVDYVKYDNCGTVAGTADNQKEYIARYKSMGDALRRASADTGHPIVYSVCEWGNYAPWSWAADRAEAQLWRTTGDISDSWSSTVSLFEQNIALSAYSHRGAYNDPDMLEIGNGAQTDEEYRSQFSLWSMMAAPLISGTPLAAAGGKDAASAATLAIYENRAVIAVDQDRLVRPATAIAHDGRQWTLARPLANGDEAVLFFNESTNPVTRSVALRRVLAPRRGGYVVRDLWAHTASTVANTLHAVVPGHGVAMFRVRAGASRRTAPAHVVLSGAVSRDYVEAGTGARLTETVFDDARGPVRAARVRLTSVPAGWVVTTLRHPARVVIRGQSSRTSSWTVRVPAGTAPGTYRIAATVRYRDVFGRHRARSTASVVVPPAPPTTTAYLSNLTPVETTGTVYHDIQIKRSQTGTTQVPITVAGTTYAKGLGASTGTDTVYYLGRQCSTLNAVVGVDDSASTFSGTPTATARLSADGTVLWQGMVTQGAAVPVTASVAGAEAVELTVDQGSGFGGTPFDWADAQVTCSPGSTG